jgi:hypothetical protein
MTAATTTQLNAEIAARKAADATNATAIAAEGKARVAGDKVNAAELVPILARLAALEAKVFPIIVPVPDTRPFLPPVTVRNVTIPATIDLTGATDVSAELAAFIASVPDGSVVAFPANATYLGHLRLSARHDLVLEGNGASLRSPGWATDILNINGSDHIAVTSLGLLGDNADAGGPNAYHSGGQEYSAGVWAKGSKFVEIANMRISRTWGDSVYVGSYPTAADWCDSLWIHDSLLELNGRCGVVVDAGRNVTIERNTINATAMHVFDIEPFSDTAEGATNVEYLDNIIGAYGLTSVYVSFFFAANGIAGSTVRDITVSRNIVAGNDAGYDGKPLGLHVLVDTARRTNIVVTDNRCDRPADGTKWPGAVMRFAHVDGLTVARNVQPLSSGILTSVVDCTGVA